MALTTTYELQKPTVGGSEDSWGTDINNNLDKIDDLLDGTLEVDGIDIISGDINGTPIGATSASTGAFTTVTATGDITGNVVGDIKATDGTVVLDNGADGTDAAFTGAVTGNASTATTLETPRALSVSGDIATSAGVDFDGSSPVDLSVTITNTLWDKIYPVGSIYTTTDDSFDPNNSFNGTWSTYAEGRVLVGQKTSDSAFNVMGETGGAKTHTLTQDEMPSHYHNTNLRVEGGNKTLVSNSLAITVSSGDSLDHLDENSTTSTRTSSKGGSDPHNNLQPYIVVKHWRRTA